MLGFRGVFAVCDGRFEELNQAPGFPPQTWQVCEGNEFLCRISVCAREQYGSLLEATEVPVRRLQGKAGSDCCAVP